MRVPHGSVMYTLAIRVPGICRDAASSIDAESLESPDECGEVFHLVANVIERASLRGRKRGASRRACERHRHARKVDDFVPSRTRHARTLTGHAAKALSCTRLWTR